MKRGLLSIATIAAVACIILSLSLFLAGCDFGGPPPSAQHSELPFTVIEKGGRLTYAIKLPDCGNLLLMADTSSGTLVITGASISSSEGILVSADYTTGQFVLFDPETKSEAVYLKSENGFVRAPETEQEKYRKMSELFKDFFGKHVGSKGDTDQAMKEMEILKERLKELNSKEEMPASKPNTPDSPSR